MWSRTFQAYGVLHLLCVGIFLAVLAVLWRWASAARSRGDVGSFGRPVGAVVFVSAAVSTLYEFTPGFYNKDISWPLNLCDLAWFAAGVALFTRRPWARALLYFWGIGLSSEALITPTLKYGPVTFDFWSFWVCHIQIVAAALIDLVVFRFRPTWAMWRRVVGLSLAYGALVTPLNLWIGTNYGFTGREVPGTPTVLDVMGPWPERIFVLCAVVLSLFTLMAWPFAGRRQAVAND